MCRRLDVICIAQPYSLFNSLSNFRQEVHTKRHHYLPLGPQMSIANFKQSNVIIICLSGPKMSIAPSCQKYTPHFSKPIKKSQNKSLYILFNTSPELRQPRFSELRPLKRAPEPRGCCFCLVMRNSHMPGQLTTCC